jgi:hypothetical protein
MSSEEGYFDILYLGVFVILSPAFDPRFYETTKPPRALFDEQANAVRRFHSILHIFDLRFYVMLDGQPLSHMYIVERMLAEFAAASVVMVKALQKDDDHLGEGIDFSLVNKRIEEILEESHPDIFAYYSRCLDRSHKQFVWTGPHLQILPRSEEITSSIPLTARGELVDLPTHPIYVIDLDPATPTGLPHVPKRQEREEDMHVDGQVKKQKV